MIEPQPLRPVERTEEDAVAGVLQVRIGGRLRIVPVLKRKWSREWKEQAARRISATDIPDTADVSEFFTTLMGVADETILDLVVAYDRSATLGGREWLDENATDRELYDALEAMVAATFPFAGASPLRSAVEAYGEQIKGLIQVRLAVFAMKLSQALSPTGSPAPTDGDQPTLTTSPTSSTSSTGRTGKTPRAAKPRTSSS